ncbi:MAG: hypothetical protein LBR90_02795, partial [Elusimicrobiota bacterium]|nr:hypothetical protein [Elusimicrobiota bacterium]
AVNADRVLSKRAQHSYLIEGNIYAARNEAGAKTELWADKIFYNRLEDRGRAEANKNKQLRLAYAPARARYDLYADALEFEDKFDLFKAAGSVELADADNTLYAQNMRYRVSTGFFEAWGFRPLFIGFSDEGDYALKADKIEAFTQQGKITARGNAQGWITFTKDFKDLKTGI